MKLWGNEQDEHLINLLKQSKQNFKHDQGAVKEALMMQIAKTNLKPAKRLKLSWSYGSAFVAVFTLVAFSSTLAYADSSNPGDKLFFLDRFQEKAVLVLPLPAANKARIQTDMVAERLKEVDKLQESRAKTGNFRAVSESEANLTEAVSNVMTAKNKMEAAGSTKAADKLDEVLVKLEILAGETEARAEKAKTGTQDEDTKQKLEAKIKNIKKARGKAQDEIKKSKKNK